MSSQIEITLNGQSFVVSNGTPLGELAEKCGLPAKAILVERNGEALFHSEWPTTPVAAGDRIEFIRMVAGG